MERRRFGNTGLEVSVLGFGGAEIGFEKAESESVGRLLNAALEAGLNVIDTAECYLDSESLIGAAVGHRRDDYLLFTKTGHASGLEGDDWDPKMMLRQIDRSLQRLQTDHLDLLQLHTCGADRLSQGDVIEVLLRAREAGKTRFIGYSGDNENAMAAISTGAFDALQTSINIADQGGMQDVLPAAQAAGLGVIAKRPVANVAWKSEPLSDAYARPYWERLRELEYDFLREALPEAISVALRFTLAQSVHVAIVGTAKPSRWEENARLLADGAMSDREVSAIRRRWSEVATSDWVTLS